MPKTTARLRILILAPYLNGNGLGEVYSIFKWVEALSTQAEVTVLSINDGVIDLASQVPAARVVTFREPAFLNKRFLKLNRAAKPWVPIFFARARRWIKASQAKGETWDIAHQMLPQAMRYASPLRGLGFPYVVGPLGGSLDTPPAFRSELTEGFGVARLRGLDHWRLRRDPWLRQGYACANLILGVAPYVGDTLEAAGLQIRKFRPVPERAYEGGPPPVRQRQDRNGALHLLHVGRGVRTKGLRDVIRALAQLNDLPAVRLTSAGDGPDLDACRTEAQALGVADRVTFLGQVPREEVDRLYAAADVFCFPSFREPMGGVFFEAMEFGLPVIAAARGGPDFILDESCALKIPVDTPDQFACDIAAAIRTLATSPELRLKMGAAAIDRLASFGTWSDRATALLELYRADLDAA